MKSNVVDVQAVLKGEEVPEDEIRLIKRTAVNVFQDFVTNNRLSIDVSTRTSEDGHVVTTFTVRDVPLIFATYAEVAINAALEARNYESAKHPRWGVLM